MYIQSISHLNRYQNSHVSVCGYVCTYTDNIKSKHFLVPTHKRFIPIFSIYILIPILLHIYLPFYLRIPIPISIPVHICIHIYICIYNCIRVTISISLGVGICKGCACILYTIWPVVFLFVDHSSVNVFYCL